MVHHLPYLPVFYSIVDFLNVCLTLCSWNLRRRCTSKTLWRQLCSILVTSLRYEKQKWRKSDFQAYSICILFLYQRFALDCICTQWREIGFSLCFLPWWYKSQQLSFYWPRICDRLQKPWCSWHLVFYFLVLLSNL